MSSYSGDPKASPKDEQRFLLQDTGPEFLFGDAEIQYALDRIGPLYGGSPEMVAAYLCDVLVASYLGEGSSISADGVSVSFADISAKYQLLGQQLRQSYQRVAGVGAAAFVGGIDHADGLPAPKAFRLHRSDNPRAAGQDATSWPSDIGDAPVESWCR